MPRFIQLDNLPTFVELNYNGFSLDLAGCVCNSHYFLKAFTKSNLVIVTTPRNHTRSSTKKR